MLGKRSRPLMNRSTSLSSSLGDLDAQESPKFGPHGHMAFIGPGPLSPRYHSDEPPEPAHFLDACQLCNRRLGNGRDIYMYRGDTAFCSEECRQQQISTDERKEKAMNGVTGVKKGQISSPTNNGGKNNKGNFQAQAETVAAA